MKKKNVNEVVYVGLLTALSVLGKSFAVTVGAFRFSFENLPILLAGMMLGPVGGAFTGGVSDIVGCLLVGHPINPIITLGASLIGLVCGFIYMKTSSMLLSVLIAHTIGSIIVKSIGLYIYYTYPISLLVYRMPQYIVIAFIECFLLKRIMPALPQIFKGHH